jgi:HEAT repeat protein
MSAASYSLSPEDRARVDRIEELARIGDAAVPELAALLDDPNWVVRRSVVSSLARIGDAATDTLVTTLLRRRDNETRIAATVDALSASVGEGVDARMMELAGGAVAREQPNGNGGVLTGATASGSASGASSATVCDAIQVLGRRRARPALSLLGDLASSADDNVAVAAIEALGRIGGVETVEPLMRAVSSTNFFRRFPAIDALGRTGDARAITPLAALLDDPFYAAEAARALGHTANEEAVRALAPLLLRPIDALVRTAAGALVDLRERFEARFGESESLSASLPKSVNAHAASVRLIQCMAGAGPSELVSIARVLGWLADEAGIDALLELVEREKPISTEAIDALRRLGRVVAPQLLAAIRAGRSATRLKLLPLVSFGKGHVDDILPCLDDPEPAVRVHACEALARLGDTAAVPAVFRLIGDANPQVAQAASGAIQSLGSAETKKLALEQARSTNARVRRAAIRILSYFGDREALDVLVEALSDPDERIRESAMYGLPLIEGPEALAAILAACRHDAPRTRAAAVRALGQTSAIEPVALALRNALEDGDPWVRYYACQSLGRLRIADAVGALVERLGDEAGQVCVAAIEALAHLPGGEAAKAVADATASKDPDLRRAALLGLSFSRRRGSIPILRAAAEAEDAATRLVAVTALAAFDEPEVVPVLAHAMSDPDESVKSAAVGYLSTRVGAEASRALLNKLDDPDLRERVIAALAVAPEHRLDDLLSALETTTDDRAELVVSVIARMRRPSSEAALAAALLAGNVAARRAAANALAKIGSKDAIAALERAAADPDPEVRRLAALSHRSG